MRIDTGSEFGDRAARRLRDELILASARTAKPSVLTVAAPLGYLFFS